MPKKIAFCTTCKGRRQHVELTLPKNLADNADCKDFVQVLVNYNSSDGLDDYLRANHQRDIDSGRLAVYHLPTPPKFQMAHAKNVAHRLGIAEGADVLVNLDADNFAGPGFASYLADQFDGDMFMWSRMVPGELARGISGRIAVPAKLFLNSGGYDERFETWSPDDKDFNIRLRRMGYKAREIDQRFLDAVLHNDKMRFREYPEAKNIDAGEDQFDAAGEGDNTVVNFGRVGCGVVFKNFGMEPIDVHPMPTRIFGIGMHKTATTSLNAALKMLGFDSAHWKSAHWARAIWEEMQSGRSATMERHYALCDLPVPLLYRQLDESYPGSKFILTVREESKWLESVRRHWLHEHNPYRQAWDADPFTHRVHKLLYGQRGFDADIFLARYRRHNAEVIEYFRGRPNDLLVMSMDDGAGWPQLCAFLKRSIPGESYPKELVTR